MFNHYKTLCSPAQNPDPQGHSGALGKHNFQTYYIPSSIYSCLFKNYQIIYIENYQPRQHRVVDTQNQGIKIINASISYPTNNTEDTLFELSPREITKDIYLSQVCEVLDLVTDDNTILVADLHFEDSDLPEEAQLEPRGLINHASDIDSFNKPGGKDEWISLQKIITTENSNINISKVICKKQEGVPFGHHPLEFTI